MAGASMVRRSAFLEAGGFEPRFFLGSEEELLAADLVAGGWWLCYVPSLIVHHYPSPKRDATARRWYVLRNALWSAWLRRPLWSALRKTRRLRSDAHSTAQVVRGLAAALMGLPWVIRHRRVVPPQVESYFRLLEQPRSADLYLQSDNACSTIKTSRATACRPEPSA
jgi:GT2 family glycosyltransferase